MKFLTVALVGGIALASASQDIDTSSGYLNYTRAWDVSDCVAPQAFNQCLKTADTDYQNRTSSCSSDDDLEIDDGSHVDCIDWNGCISLADQLNCAMSFCWNRVYSCDYQKVATELAEFCNVGGDEDDDEEDHDGSLATTFAGIPYYAAPDDAPGGCSCNLGGMLVAMDKELGNVYSCGGGDDYSANLSQTCSCCAYSGAMSIYYNICPTTDPKDVGIDVLISGIVGGNFTFSTCDATLASTDCASTLNITSSSSSNTTTTTLSFPNIATLSSAAVSATGVLSDLGGQVTSPASGYTLTWTANSTPYTITATSAAVPSLSSTAKAGGAAAAASGSKGASSAVSGSARSSATGNAGVRVEVGGVVVLGAVALLAQL